MARQLNHSSPRRRVRGLRASAAILLCLGSLGLAACEQRTGLTAATDPDPDLPDYAVSIEQYETEGPLDDLSTIQFQVRVVNNGVTDTVGTSVAMYVDGEFAGDQAVHGLPTLEDTTLTFAWAAQAGPHEIVFGVDEPPLDTTFVAESDEGNNSATTSLSLPYGVRTIESQATMQFADLPSAVAADSLVEQILDLAADSGYSAAPGAPMIRTRYSGGMTSFHVPLVDLRAPADSAPVLVINHSTAGGAVTFPYLFDVVDSTTLVFYDAHGGALVSDDGESMRLTSLRPQTGTCAEGWVWPCVVKVGIEPLAECVLAIYQAAPGGTVEDLLFVLSRHGCAVALPAFASVRQNLVDNPPTAFLVVGGGRSCDKCVGNDLHAQVAWSYHFVAVDDRGPVTYLSGQVWQAPCGSGGSYTFSARDNAGQTVTAAAVSSSPVVYPGACHNQGGGRGAMLAPSGLQRWKGAGGGKRLALGEDGRAGEKPRCESAVGWAGVGGPVRADAGRAPGHGAG